MTFGDAFFTVVALVFTALFWVGLVRFGYLDNVLWTVGAITGVALLVRWRRPPTDPNRCECGHWLQPEGDHMVCVMGCAYESRRQEDG